MTWSELLGVVGGAIGLASPFVLFGLKRGQDHRDRVTTRSETAAQQVLTTIEAIRELYEQRFQWVDAQPPAPGSIQGDQSLREALKNLRGQLVLVNDTNVRSRIGLIADALGYSSAIHAFQGDTELAAGLVLCEHANEVLGAFLRHEALPPEHERVVKYRAAMVEADRIAEAAYDAEPTA